MIQNNKDIKIIDKQDIYNFFCDKKGNLSSSKLKWPNIKLNKNRWVYEYLINAFPDVDENEHKPLDILYRVFYNIEAQPKCPICGNILHVLRFNRGFEKFCTLECKHTDEGKKFVYEKTKQTFMKHYGTTTPMRLDSVKKKQEETNMKKYSYKSTAQDPTIKQKQIDTLMKHYGVDNPFKSPILYNKAFETKMKSWNNISKTEKLFNNYLTENNYNFKIQYNNDLYPFHCDFYIEPLNLYIEIQGSWTHGYHPYDSNNINDKTILNLWLEKSKTSTFFKKAIEVWTISDVFKRNTAIKNNLKYLEIFSCKLKNVIDAFNNYLQQTENYKVYSFDK